MSVELDTSVVLRLLTGQPREQSDAARAFVSTSSSPVTVSDLVVAESYFALRHHYGVPHSDAVGALFALLSDARVRATGVARRVLADPAARLSSKTSAGFVDRLIHASAANESATLVTFDRALARLAGVQLLRAAP